MIVVSNTTAQTLQPGQSITFDTVLYQSGNGECRNIRNRAIASLRNCGTYAIGFSGNIGAVAPGPAQLAIQVGGYTLAETTMISTTAAAGDLNNVSTETRYRNGCGDTFPVTVTNTGTAAITVGANTSLVVDRRG